MPNTITMGVVFSTPLQRSSRLTFRGFHVLVLDSITFAPLRDQNGRAFNRSYATGSASAGAAEAARWGRISALWRTSCSRVHFSSFLASASQPTINPTAPSSVSPTATRPPNHCDYDHVLWTPTRTAFPCLGHVCDWSLRQDERLGRLPDGPPDASFFGAGLDTGSGDHLKLKGTTPTTYCGAPAFRLPSSMAWRDLM